MSEHNDANKQQEEKFNLYTENIVVKRSVKYKPFFRILRLVGSAVLFGGVSCVTFIFLYPFLYDNYKADSADIPKTIISIPSDQYPEGYVEGTEENSTKTYGIQQESEAVSNFQNSYAILQDKMLEAKKSVVTISAYHNDDSDFLNKDKSADTAGIIIAASGGQYKILTSYTDIKDSSGISVVFDDGTIAAASYFKGDSETDIAIIQVTIEDQSNMDTSSIKAAVLDNSYLVNQGDVVIAVGRILGNNSSVSYGITTNIKAYKSGTDSSYNLLTTNISKGSSDYAYLFNESGNIIGVMKTGTEGEQGNTIIAYGISDLKPLIEKMANYGTITYLGITGQNVTSNIAATYSLPIGIYVSQVNENSPAYAAGIQKGDVIISINGESILTMKVLTEKLYSYSGGTSIQITAKRLGKDGYKNIDFSVTLGDR